MAIAPVVGSILQCVEMLDVEDDTHECVAQIMNMYEKCSVLRVVEEILTDDALPTPSGTFVLSAISLMLLCLLIVQHFKQHFRMGRSCFEVDLNHAHHYIVANIIIASNPRFHNVLRVNKTPKTS
jgi:hypothetical protein